jgi:hypothetical protein
MLDAQVIHRTATQAIAAQAIETDLRLLREALANLATWGGDALAFVDQLRTHADLATQLMDRCRAHRIELTRISTELDAELPQPTPEEQEELDALEQIWEQERGEHRNPDDWRIGRRPPRRK